MEQEELVRGTTIEQLSVEEGLPMFFWWAELVHPEGVQQLTALVSAMATQSSSATEQDIQEGLTEENLNLGFDVISSWLDEVGAGGFRSINVLKRKALLAGAAVKGIRLPKKESITEEGIKILKPFSTMVKKAEAEELTPVEIIGNLLYESVGSKPSASGSVTLREQLATALGGERNLPWLWMPLGIRDAARQSGFREKTTQPAGKEERREQVDQPKARQAERVSPAEKELPAFLKGDELPEGYQWVDFPNESEQWIALGEKEGSAVTCYVQGLGVRLTRGPRNITYVELVGIPAPYNISPTEKGIPLSEVPLSESERDARPKSLYLQTSRNFRQRSTEFESRGWRYVVTVPFQTVVRLGGTDFTTPDFGPSGVSFSTYPAEGSRGKIQIRNENLIFGAVDRIAIPSVAIVRVGGMEAAQRKVEPKTAVAQTEMVLTLREREVIGVLGTVAELEEGKWELAVLARVWGFADGEKYLQSLFRGTQSSFHALPADSRLRAEMIQSALGQLGETGEKLKKAGKNDEEIFSEWLRQVFLALYKRAVKT